MESLDFDFKNKPKFINCAVHGENSPCLVNQKCIACVTEKKTSKENYETEERIKALKIANGVPIRYLSATFNNYLITNEMQRAIVSSLQEYNAKSNAVLVGQTGTGKTHLAIACLNQLLRIGKNGFYIKFYQLAKIQIHDKYYFERLIKADFLIIDEFGTSDSDYKSSLMFEVIDQRYDNALSTMLISNLTNKALKEKMSDMLYSRIKECCASYSFSWQDYRLRSK